MSLSRKITKIHQEKRQLLCYISMMLEEFDIRRGNVQYKYMAVFHAIFRKYHIDREGPMPPQERKWVRLAKECAVCLNCAFSEWERATASWEGEDVPMECVYPHVDRISGCASRFFK
jgi:hypothetical protein